MNINVRTNISQDYGEDIEIVVNTSKFTKEVGEIIETLQQITSRIDSIIGKKGNEISVINIDEIICFYSSEQNNYCKTDKGEFVIKQKLYELEESLPKNDFIRISNSTIINIKFVKCFDVSMIGNILVKFKDGTSEYVSKRRVSRCYEIFEREREEIGMKKVLKNMFKSISAVCLIVVILSAIFYGVWAFMLNKYVDINNGELIVKSDENISWLMNERVTVLENENEEVYRNYTAYAINILPITLNFVSMLQVLFYSIIIGGIIGIAISMDEFSKRRMVITYIGTYLIIVAFLLIIEREGYTTWNVSNALGIAFEFFIMYTVLFGLTILGKKIYNKRQSKLMNKELNINVNS